MSEPRLRSCPPESRAVVTGLGLISAVGNSVEECWSAVTAGKSGIRHTSTVDTTGCYADCAAEVDCPDLDATPGTAGMDRASKLCVRAAGEAMRDAGLDGFGGSPRAAVIMGSCVGGVVSIEEYYTKGKTPERATQMPISAIATQVARVFGAGGVVTNIANACAAGTIAVSYAADLIRAGKADIVIAGGADAFASVPYAGFLSLHALDPRPCSPFNRSEGITLGEGAGAVIVESYRHAAARGARVYCDVLGSGVSSDAYHITAPRPDGEGQMNAIRRAMENSGLGEADIGYVNAHGTGTAKNDEAEFLSLHTLFDGKNPGLSVSSTKSMTGHCLGAAGAIEAVFAIKALTTGVIPPTTGYTEEDLARLREKAGELDFCPNTARRKPLRNVMSNSFAFGGNNASVIFGAEPGEVRLPPAKKPGVALTGIGIVTPLGNGRERYAEAVAGGERIDSGSARSSVGTDDYAAMGLKMAFYRKLDRFSQLQAVSGMMALRDGDYSVTDDNARDTGILVGTSEGALGSGCDFEANIAEKGNSNGSAFKFPNTVYNAAGGYLSICSGIKGYNVTATNGAQSGLQSIAYAANVIRSGEQSAMLATGTDENSDILDELYRSHGCVAGGYTAPYSGGNAFSLSDGSVSLLLENESGAASRGATVYAKVTGYGMAASPVEFGRLEGSGEALTRAIRDALEDAGLDAGDVDAVAGFANGHAVVDGIERDAVAEVFGENVPVLSVKETVGEARAAAAALSVAHSALLLHGEIESAPAYCLGADGSVTRRTLRGEGLRNIVAVSYGAGGVYCAVVVSK